MIDLYLKFADEQEANTYLKNAEGKNIYSSTDVIGEIFNVDYTNPLNPISTQIPGWHVNIRTEEYDPALDAFKVNPMPATPRRVWF
jgi:hypothetical protein